MQNVLASFGRRVLKTDSLLLRILLWALMVKLLLIVLIVWRMGPVGLVNIVDDGTTYQQIARNLIAGNGYSMSYDAPYVPDAIRVPLVPFLMVLSLKVFGSIVPFALLCAFLSLLQAYAVWYIVGALGMSRTAAACSAIAVALEPSGLMLSVLAISEPIFVTLFLLALYSAIRWQKEGQTRSRTVLLGLCLGLAALTRPIGLYAVPIVLGWLLYTNHESWRQIGVSSLIVVLLVAPWFVRNERVFGVLSYSSGGVQNIYFHFGSTLLSMRDGVSINDTNFAQYENAARISGLSIRQVEQQDLRLNSLLTEEAFRIILENPGAAFKTFFYTQFAFFTNDSYRFYYFNRLFDMTYDAKFNPTLEMFQHPISALPKLFDLMKHEWFLSIIGRAFFVLTSLLGVIGLMRMALRSGYSAHGVLFLLVVAYFALASATGGHGITVRYRYPVQAVLYVGALWSISEFVRMRKASKTYEGLQS